MAEQDLTTNLTGQLEHCIGAKCNDTAKSLLRQILRLPFNPLRNSDLNSHLLGRLLLRSSACNNDVFVEHLIVLGVDVDYLNKNDETSFMQAVKYYHLATIKALLRANANVDIVSAKGLTALEMIFVSEHSSLFLSDETISKLLLERAKAGTTGIEELVDKLLAGGCTLYKAVHLRDIQVIQCMLDRGLDVNSKCICYEKTALHAAAELSDLDLINWLVDRNADVNALDKGGNSPIFTAASRECTDVVKTLLERGADPNIVNHRGWTAFTLVFLRSTSRTDDCLELLLQYGAIPQNISSHSQPLPLLGIAFEKKTYSKITMLIDYLAVLKILGNPIATTFLEGNKDIPDFAVVEKRLESFEEYLKSKIFGKLSMLQLLTDSERKMRIHARNDTLVKNVQKCVSADVNKKNSPYYCNTLARRISTAVRMVKLEDAAIPVLCKIINGNQNECYIAARKIVSYLDEKDLEHVVQL